MVARLLLLLLSMLALSAQLPPPTLADVQRRIASYPPDLQAYSLFRFWLTNQPPQVQTLFENDTTRPAGLDLYRRQLRMEAVPSAEIERRMQIISKNAEHWEIEMWNHILTSDSPRINRSPNAFLVAMVQGRKPGRALDVGMGQGRNAVWLAQQGWRTTGFDPAAKAVALAQETAARAGAKLNAVVAKDSEFDMGDGQWDLILLSYVDFRHLADRISRALAPGGIVIAEYFHRDSPGTAGGYADNELAKLFPNLRLLRYEDADAIADFGLDRVRLVRLLAEKRR